MKAGKTIQADDPVATWKRLDAYARAFLLLVVCLYGTACFEFPGREQLNKYDNKIMVLIFGEPLSKEMHLMQVSYMYQDWDGIPARLNYQLEMTTETLEKAEKAEIINKARKNDYREDQLGLIFRFIDNANWGQEEKINRGLIEIYKGKGFYLSVDQRVKPLNASLYIYSKDLFPYK